MMLHPHRVSAVLIGAPGYVTLLDDSLNGWPDTADFETVFAQPLDTAALARVAVRIIVGNQNLDKAFMSVPPDSPIWAERSDAAGHNRVERAQALAENLRRNGLTVELVLADECRHAFTAAIQSDVVDFLVRSAAPPRIRQSRVCALASVRSPMPGLPR